MEQSIKRSSGHANTRSCAAAPLTPQACYVPADDYWFGEQRQSDANTEWRDTLRDARNNKAEARVICQCMGKNEDHALRRLVVRYRTDTDKFYLSAWQFTGGQHRHDCRFYSIWQDKSSAKGLMGAKLQYDDI
ncbi:DUF1173 family protein [Klebsiella aerogenes]